MPPRSKKTAPPSTPMEGRYKNRSKPQPPPEFQSQQELSSQDDSSTLKDVKKTLGTLPSDLAAITTQVDSLTNNRASQVAPLSVQHGTSAVKNPTGIPSAIFDPNTDKQVQICINQ